MSQLLILGSAIIASNPIESDDAFTTPDAVYPKHVIEGYEVVTADVPDGFTVQGHEWIDGAVAAKAPVVVPPTQAEINDPIYAALEEIDKKSIRALREGNVGRCEELEAQAVALRAQLVI